MPHSERVARVLFRHGRMTVSELVRYLHAPQAQRPQSSRPHLMGSSSTSKSKSTAIPSRLVQQALMVLIQHHCVLHSRTSADTGTGQEYFEMDTYEILCRLRFGAYLDLAYHWGGEDVRSLLTPGANCDPSPLIPRSNPRRRSHPHDCLQRNGLLF